MRTRRDAVAAGSDGPKYSTRAELKDDIAALVVSSAADATNGVAGPTRVIAAAADSVRRGRMILASR